jgi:hypothetical protein
MVEKAQVTDTEYWFLKKWLTVKQENTNEQIVLQNHSQKIYQIIVYVYTGFPLFYGFSR